MAFKAKFWPAIEKELTQICKETGATLLTIGSPSDPWNKPLALNTGIRTVPAAIPTIMTMDADMILAPDFFDVVTTTLQQKPQTLVLCRSADLPPQVKLPGHESLLAHFQQLQARSRLRPSSGTSGIQAAPRRFFHDIRGYDEELLWWGAMDGDMVTRAKLAGLEIVWVDNKTAMLHQWHPRKHRLLNSSQDVRQAKKYWQRNHQTVAQRAHLLQRNAQGWGGECV